MEDWRWRMVTPLRGDAASVPVNAAARAVIDAWDPAKDEAAGDECKAYGAPALLRVPGRLRIRWLDDDTLEIQADAGSKRGTLHFGAPPPASAAAEPARLLASRLELLDGTRRPRRRAARHGAGPARAEPHARGRDDALAARVSAQERHSVQRRERRSRSTSIGSPSPTARSGLR